MMTFVVRLCAVAALACFLIATITVCFPTVAHAGGGNPDQDLAEKKGVEGLFKGKGVAANDPRLAKPWQKYLALGSVAVTFVLWKFL